MVKFGEWLSELYLNRFAEIACGLAIPSLTLSKLGHRGGKIIDIDPKALAIVGDFKNRLGCELKIQRCDIFKDRPKLQKGERLVAEKPASYKKST